MAEVIIVLGMHRSGTSCLTGSLQAAGLELGDVVTCAPHNAKGNRENLRIMKLHNALLGTNGGAWDDPPEKIIWSDAQRSERDAIMGDYVGLNRWGFKDPRTLFTLDGWLEVLDEVKFVGTVRHPRAVAASLSARNGGPLDRWFALWARYNARLLALHDRHSFPLVDFDRDEASYREVLPKVFSYLGLGGGSVADFFEPELRHHADVELAIPPDIEDLYRTLRSRTLRP